MIAGPTFWPVEAGAEVLSVYREFLPNAPRELNGFFAFATVPPGPPFPEEIHLRKVCGVVWCYVGGEEDAAKAMAPLLEAGARAASSRRAADAAPGAAERVRRASIRRATSGTGAPTSSTRSPTRRSRLTRGSAPRCRPGSRRCTCIRSMARPTTSARRTRPGAIATRTGARSSPASTPIPANVDEIRQWTVDYFEALHPHSAGGAYVNMMMDEGQERVRASYRDNYDRLAEIKAKYDPDNFFRVNQNIEPKRVGRSRRRPRPGRRPRGRARGTRRRRWSTRACIRQSRSRASGGSAAGRARAPDR